MIFIMIGNILFKKMECWLILRKDLELQKNKKNCSIILRAVSQKYQPILTPLGLINNKIARERSIANLLILKYCKQ